MTALKNHTLLYDTNCPLCSVYTNAFIKTGLLDASGRISYEEGLKRYTPQVDACRSRNEIALINRESGEVKYGMESLLYILSSKFIFLKPLVSNALFIFLSKKLYAFISYNRKVIATSESYLQQTCVPDFNLFYRLLYIIFTAMIGSSVLSEYANLLQPILPPSHPYREYAICFGQLFFQGGILIAMQSKKEAWFDYIGNMMTVSLIGSLLLLPFVILNHYFFIPAWFYLAYFFAVFLIMFLHHRRRIKNIAAPSWLSYTWILYRVIVLLIIL